MDAPLLTFDLPALLAQVKCEGTWARAPRTGLTLLKGHGLRVVLVALHAGTTIPSHQTDSPISVQVIEGAAGALHRYLAEAVWFPTALLSRHGVVWTPLDESSARATLSVAATTVSLDLHFGDGSLVHRVYTSARAREVEGRAVLTPWQGRFSDYAERDGMRIPLTAEVEWILPEGPQLHWRGRMTEIAYEYAQPR
jgi:hypothetical protein